MLTIAQSQGYPVLSKLPGTLNIWPAWPIFDVRFYQFELEQWMKACIALLCFGPTSGSAEITRSLSYFFSYMDSEFERHEDTSLRKG